MSATTDHMVEPDPAKDGFKDLLVLVGQIEAAWSQLPGEYYDRAQRTIDTSLQALPGYRRQPSLDGARWSAAMFPGLLAVAAWITVFSLGAVVPSASYQAVLGTLTTQTWSATLTAALVVLGCSTYTNPAFLACCAALIGSTARELSSPAENERICHLSAVFRGFFVYLALMAGLMLLTTDAILKATQAQYVQLAATMSITAYLVGYDPAIFRRLLERFSGEQKTILKGHEAITIEHSKDLTLATAKRR